MSLVRKITFYGLLIPLCLYIYEQYVAPSKYYTPTPSGIEQKLLPVLLEPTSIIDPVTGLLKVWGY